MSFSKPVKNELFNSDSDEDKHLNSPKERNSNFEYKNNIDGSINKNYIDLLDEDKPIAGQKYCCISFISPENIIKQKEMFYMEQFLNNWDFSKSMEKFTQFLNFLSYKYSINLSNLQEDMTEFVKEEKTNLIKNNLLDDYKNYLDANEDRLEKDFNEMYNFQTAVRGLKIRGCFPSQKEAELKCKQLREVDPFHDVYVGTVGVWMPFHPDAYKTGRIEYLEEELNQLMHEKKKNEDKAKEEFDKRVKDAKMNAMEDNKIKALKSGNKLTQTINEEGNLINVKNIQDDDDNTYDNLSEYISAGNMSANIRKELFEENDTFMNKKLN